MALQIRNGGSSPYRAEVTSESQLKVEAEIHELQHHEALLGDTYQVISVDTGITAKTQTIMHLKNTDANRICVVSFIRIQAITSTTLPAVGEYFEIGYGRTVSSGGTTTTPVNTNAASGNTASVTATGIDPTMTGTFTAIDRYYPSSQADMVVYNKQGSVILGLNDTFEVRFVSAGTGEAMCRITFMMIKQ